MSAAKGWGEAKQSKAAEAAKPQFDRAHYKALFDKQKSQRPRTPIRMALVGKENTAKTGLALSLALTPAAMKAKKKVVIIDIDNSASETVAHLYPDYKHIQILSLFDESDDSLFNADNTTFWPALIDKAGWFCNLIAEDIEEEGKDAYAAIIFDGGSTFLKWCEFSMNWFLMNRSKNPVNVEDGDRFNQAEWRKRNSLFRDIINRVQSLSVDKVFFTFHLKDEKTFMDIGGGAKGLMKIGEKVEWVEGTQRIVSQQIWLRRYAAKADSAAGIQKDDKLKAGEFVIRAEINEIKGRGMEHLGEVHEVLSVKGGKVVWSGLPFLEWE